MGQVDDLPENSDALEPSAAEAILRTVTTELENLKQSLIVDLNQDIERLSAEKKRLSAEIEGLHAQRQQEVEQQQQLLKHLAQGLANQLQEQMIQHLQQLADNPESPMNSYAGMLPTSWVSEYNESAYRLIASLDTTIRTAFNTLQQDLNSYQSALSQQLGHMHSLEQQGEVILETLVNRLTRQLQAEAPKLQLPPTDTLVAEPPNQPTTPNGVEPPAAPQPLPLQPKKQLSQLQLGFLLVMFSTVALSLHNVVVGIVFSPSQIFGKLPLGGFIHPTLGNSLLILWMRMIVVLPLMAFVSMRLHPPVWTDIKRFFTARDNRAIALVVGSGCCLFLSQVLIYIAIGDIGPGIAVTILFMYPIITVPLAWLLFADRPTVLRLGVMVTIALGIVCAALPKILSSHTVAETGVFEVGVATAIGSGIAFAFYLIFMQLGFKKLHPVPVTLIQFVTIFFLTSTILILPFPLKIEVVSHQELPLIFGGLILGALTLLGYLLNNFGVRFLGAARASIIASSGPALTALLTVVIIPGPKTYLQQTQIIGIVLVTVGVLALSFERMLIQRQAPKPVRT